MSNDHELLRKFTAIKDQAAFEELLQRHVHSIYSTARRIVRDERLAEEIAQDAFCLLALKAAQIPLNRPVIAWLHRSAWNLAMKARRGEQRRQTREREGIFMSEDHSETDRLWEHLAPVLDEAVEALPPADRHAILLRFFQRQSAREIGIALEISDVAARARVSRAVEKLRQFFARRGVACTAGALSAMLAGKVIEAAPAASISAIRSAALLAQPQSWFPPLLKSVAQIELKTVAACAVALLALALAVARIHRALALSSAPDLVSKPMKNSSGAIVSTSPSIAARMAALFGRHAGSPAEEDALAKLREILFSPDRDSFEPPVGVKEAIEGSGAQMPRAVALLREALGSPDEKVRGRTLASLQFVRAAGDEFAPDLIEFLRDAKPVSGDANSVSNQKEWLGNVGSTLGVLRPSSELMPELVQILQSNPAATDGIKYFFKSYAYAISWTNTALGPKAISLPRDEAHLTQNLEPLLESANEEERLCAAIALAPTRMRTDPRLLAILMDRAVKEEANYAVALGAYNQITDTQQHPAYPQSLAELLTAVQRMGPAANSAAPFLQSVFTQSPPPLSASSATIGKVALRALAAVAPELRSEIPELDSLLRQGEEAAALEVGLQKPNPTVSDLLAALDNPVVRVTSVSQLARMGRAAEAAPPRLREIVAAGPTNSPDNFLISVARAIHAIDPQFPIYYDRQMLFTPAVIEAANNLGSKTNESAKGLCEEAAAQFLGAPTDSLIDGNELTRWVERFRAEDSVIGDTLLRAARKSLALESPLSDSDPAVAKLLGK